MTLSLKQIAKDCVEISPPFSVIRDFIGYRTGSINPGGVVSLKSQLQLVKGKSIGINIITVGEDFQRDEYEEIQSGIQYTRDVFSKVNLGVRKIEWYYISDEKANGYATIDSRAEAKDLTNDWSVQNEFLDLFVVHEFTYDAVGRSAIDGSCDKDNGKQSTGSVVSLYGTCSGSTFAHEIAHYLGLKHSLDDSDVPNDDEDNLMSVPPHCDRNKLTSEQGKKMKKHCFVKDVC